MIPRRNQNYPKKINESLERSDVGNLTMVDIGFRARGSSEEEVGSCGKSSCKSDPPDSFTNNVICAPKEKSLSMGTVKPQRRRRRKMNHKAIGEKEKKSYTRRKDDFGGVVWGDF